MLLLVASETGHVYTFATPKLQPLITKAEGKNLIQSCLNAQEPAPAAPVHTPRLPQGGFNDPSLLYPAGDSRENQMEPVYDEDKKVWVNCGWYSCLRKVGFQRLPSRFRRKFIS